MGWPVRFEACTRAPGWPMRGPGEQTTATVRSSANTGNDTALPPAPWAAVEDDAERHHHRLLVPRAVVDLIGLPG